MQEASVQKTPNIGPRTGGPRRTDRPRGACLPTLLAPRGPKTLRAEEPREASGVAGSLRVFEFPGVK